MPEEVLTADALSTAHGDRECHVPYPFYVWQHNSADHKPIIRFHLETHITIVKYGASLSPSTAMAQIPEKERSLGVKY